mgnify:CR=1 FL=1
MLPAGSLLLWTENLKTIIRALFPLVFLLVLAPTSALGPLPEIKPPTILPFYQALFREETGGMELKFLELDRDEKIMVWSYLQGPIW